MGEWLKGKRDGGAGRKWTVGKVVYWGLRMGLIAGCLVFTFFESLEAASPRPLDDSL